MIDASSEALCSVPAALIQGMTMLVRLIYGSTVAQPMGPETLSHILKQARVRNALRGLTGLPTFDSVHFMQAIEGSPQAVNELYNSVLRDVRHDTVRLLSYSNIDTRLFADWDMGFLSASAAHRALYAPMISGPRFDPYALRSDQAERLLADLARTAADAGIASA